MRSALPAGSTLLTIGASEEYVRRVLLAMAECRRTLGEPFVEISLTSDPTAPDYRITAEMAPESRTTFTVNSGRTHRYLTGKKADDWRQWSNENMSFREVQSLIGKIRHPELN